MRRPMPPASSGPTAATRTAPQCPSWCVVAHGQHRGEEDWLHLSEPVRLVKEVEARLATTIGPGRQGEDGPYLMIGSDEYTLGEAAALGAAITAVARAAVVVSFPQQPEGTLPVLDPQLPQH